MTPKTIQRLLVPTDFQPNAAVALDWAITLARKFEASLLLFHAGVVPPVAYADFVTWPVGPIEEAARNAMQTVLNGVTRDFARAEARVRVGISAADEIIATADEWNADVIVMGSHGRRGIRRLVMGSVAENVLRHSKRPVWIIPPDERAS